MKSLKKGEKRIITNIRSPLPTAECLELKNGHVVWHLGVGYLKYERWALASVLGARLPTLADTSLNVWTPGYLCWAPKSPQKHFQNRYLTCTIKCHLWRSGRNLFECELDSCNYLLLEVCVGAWNMHYY